MGGGISSDIFVVHRPGQPDFVVKQALSRLRVQADWRADTSRNRVEHQWLRHAARVVPGHVPVILHCDDAVGYFAMEYLGTLTAWKSSLMAGTIQPAVAETAGTLLGRLHAATWNSEEARATFATDHLFHALRIDPYLLATGERHTALRPYFQAEAERLAATKQALVHGDYSPKNLLVDAERFVIVDAEAGWFGDPVFDVAFALTHFHLKSLYHARNPEKSAACLELVAAFIRGYATGLKQHWTEALEARAARLLLLLLLARIDGKSPAEYLTEPAQRDFVRDFVRRHLPSAPARLSSLTAAWSQSLSSHAHH